jgi:large subunit ribosomal protein L5
MIIYKENYEKKVIPAFREHFGVTNVMAMPKITKVTLNVGLGKAVDDKGWIEVAENVLKRITGQKPVLIKARKSISNFKLREGMVIGVKATLRGKRMEDFIDKLLSITFSRVRDFRGLDSNKGFDQNGNLTVGFSEYNIFPEIRSDEVEKLHGVEVSFTTTCGTREKGLEFFTLLGFPFKK